MKNIRNIMALLAAVVGLMGMGNVLAAGRNPFAAAPQQQSVSYLNKFLKDLAQRKPLPAPNAYADSEFTSELAQEFADKIAGTPQAPALFSWVDSALRDPNTVGFSLDMGEEEPYIISNLVALAQRARMVRLACEMKTKVLNFPAFLKAALAQDCPSDHDIIAPEISEKILGWLRAPSGEISFRDMDENKLEHLANAIERKVISLRDLRIDIEDAPKQILANLQKWSSLAAIVKREIATKKSNDTWRARKKFAVKCFIGAAAVIGLVAAWKYRSNLNNFGYKILRWWTPLGVAETAEKVGEFYHPHHAPPALVTPTPIAVQVTAPSQVKAPQVLPTPVTVTPVSAEPSTNPFHTIMQRLFGRAA